MSHPHAPGQGAPAPAAPEAPLDLREKGGPKNGQPQLSDRRLFVQLLAFTGARGPQALIDAASASGLDCVVYEEANDPAGVAVLALAEDPALFVTGLRAALARSGALDGLTLKPELCMIGRTYALGYEPDLEDWLLKRPRRVSLDASKPWAVWYPLRRSGAFARLPRPEQMQILKEHSVIGRRFGDAGHAQDVRLACHGLDKSDNDFVIGLIGAELHPLSALVEAMRPTVQTSQYLDSIGPFFVGRVAWRSPVKP